MELSSCRLVAFMERCFCKGRRVHILASDSTETGVSTSRGWQIHWERTFSVWITPNNSGYWNEMEKEKVSRPGCARHDVSDMVALSFSFGDDWCSTL